MYISAPKGPSFEVKLAFAPRANLLPVLMYNAPALLEATLPEKIAFAPIVRFPPFMDTPPQSDP
jgi:hypothetical protein